MQNFALLPEFCLFVFICIRLFFIGNNVAKFLTNKALGRILNCQYWHYIAILHFLHYALFFAVLPNTQAKILSLPYQSITPLGLSVHGARSIYIYDLHHALKIVAKRFLKHFPTIIWRMFYFFVLLNPRNASAHFGQQYLRVLSKYSVVATIWLQFKRIKE